MKKFLLLMTALLSFNAAAGSCSQQVANIGGLDKATKQEMIIKCEQAKLANINTTPEVAGVNTEKLDKWSEISLKFAKAIGVAAKEVGVATNEFLSTPAGKFTAVIIAWKVFDGTSWVAFAIILSITTGILVSFKRFMTHKGYEDYEGKLGKRRRHISSTWGDMDDNQAAIIIISYIIYIAVVFFTGINLF